jgi:mono/diheme cytochrome c family protein
MTPFGGMVNDEEMAAVLTFVRNSFGNKSDAITSEQVKKVRAAFPGRVNMCTVEELLKEFPLEK